ncbi:hypothetical protein BCR37DRAFT_115185 [Protomyces lactucae-debilis]|uniref:Uncharacterized protein n=1 Tax=Protomyces lactucae-debilis TaxID=2754530 RepID=A0A1Y2F2V3_PROLT|nr:uncharacterized protein BCR37DRAFT_115185 [Protomyces lactucae-debilis]ORY78173.1 hypothetical protein BCR37DRAFT_115185 [Protomyces lactucae-debilis]
MEGAFRGARTCVYQYDLTSHPKLSNSRLRGPRETVRATPELLPDLNRQVDLLTFKGIDPFSTSQSAPSAQGFLSWSHLFHGDCPCYRWQSREIRTSRAIVSDDFTISSRAILFYALQMSRSTVSTSDTSQPTGTNKLCHNLLLAKENFVTSRICESERSLSACLGCYTTC